MPPSRHQLGFELLRALHQHAEAHPGQPFSETEIELAAGVSPIQMDLAVDGLLRAGYATEAGDGTLAVTPRGAAEMEARGEAWKSGSAAIMAWLDEEKARVTGLPEELTRKKEAIEEARRRRMALQTRLRDLRERFAD